MAIGWVDYDDQVDVAHQGEGEGGEGDLGAFSFQVVLQCHWEKILEQNCWEVFRPLWPNEEYHTLTIQDLSQRFK